MADDKQQEAANLDTASGESPQTIKQRALAKRLVVQKQQLRESLSAKQEGRLAPHEITTLNLQVQNLSSLRGFSFLDADRSDPFVIFDVDAADGIIALPPDRL